MSPPTSRCFTSPNPLPEAFAKDCNLKSYFTVPPANSADLNASYAAVNAIAPTLLIYASVGLLLALSLRARRENVVPGLTFRQGVLAIPYWSAPLGVITLVCALTVEWLARRWAIDIGSVRDLGSVGEFIFARPLLAFLLIVVTAPVFEELLFRRWLLDGFLRANMPVFGSIVVSVNFALPHITHYAMTTAFVVAFALFFAISLMLCAVYLRTRNVLACIVLHMAHNGSALLADWWTGPS
jgi:membrane protease YdiL (CAAX protease family)